MKKLLVVMTALAMVFGIAAAAHAAGAVQMTLTSPTIVKKGCEKAGSVTFAFDANTVITAGDWWYMDLPGDVSICKAIDYLITGGNAGTVNINGGPTATVFGVAADSIGGAGGAIAVGAAAAQGPLSVVSAGAGAANTVIGNGAIVLRVTAAAGSQRVFIQAYGATAAADIAVGASSTFNIKILDGALHNGFILRDTTTPAVGGGVQKKANGIYNDAPAAGDELVGPIPDVNNTLCINAENTSSTLIFVSFNSLNDKFTFSGDSQIAHVGAENSIVLASCKGETEGYIEIGSQNSCSFGYESVVIGTVTQAPGYCPPPTAEFIGNRLLIQGASTFGDPGDLWDLTILSDTPGVYFSDGAWVYGYTPSRTDQCTAFGAVALANGAFLPTSPAGTGVGNNNLSWPTNSCAVESEDRVNKIATTKGGLAGINTYDRLWINLPTMVYDTSIIGDGVEVDITVIMGKYPCGDFFEETRTIGTFVTTCPVGTGGTTLMYPFLPPMDGSIPGWWGGFTINNASTAAGGAELVFWEMDGDTATYSVSSIAAGGMWTMATADLLAAVTPGTGNAGTFGDANVMITVTCDFNQGGGFAFTGNGDEGTGYTAYVLGTTGWQ